MQQTRREDLSLNFLPQQNAAPVAWRIAPDYVPYPAAIDVMEAHAAQLCAGTAPEMVWLLEHPPLYTAGTSAKPNDLLDANQLPIYQTGRGGQYTYHGPGQRVAYIMLDLQRRYCDIRRFVASLEEWIITSLAAFNIQGLRREDRVGVWVRTPGGEKKIAAIGIKIRKWISFHGIAINLNPQLAHYAGIVPCGQREFGTTSLHELGVKATMPELDQALAQSFVQIFGPMRYE